MREVSGEGGGSLFWGCNVLWNFRSLFSVLGLCWRLKASQGVVELAGWVGFECLLVKKDAGSLGLDIMVRRILEVWVCILG